MKHKFDRENVGKRIGELINFYKMSDSMFAKIVNIDTGNFNKKMNGKLPWTIFDINKICANTIVQRQWLENGEGEMVRNETFEPTMKMLPSDFDNNSDGRRIISYDPTVGKPYYNVDFEMGYDFMINNQTSNPDYMINFAPYNKCDYWCNAIGDSMHPTISSGDVIAVKEIKDYSYLISGEIYAIITDNGLRTVKRIKDNGDSITLIPDNKEYPEQTIKRDNIRKVFRVLGSMKMF